MTLNTREENNNITTFLLTESEMFSSSENMQNTTPNYNFNPMFLAPLQFTSQNQVQNSRNFFNPTSTPILRSTIKHIKNKLDSDKTKRKIIALIIFGAFLFVTGVVLAVLFFHERNHKIVTGEIKPSGELDLTDTRTITGPLFISSGLLITICGITWIPIYKEKKTQEKIRKRNIEQENVK